MPSPPYRCLVVTGPTATGKTRLAVALARRFDGEIVSADSRQVFRGMDIGTGKDMTEYTTGGIPVPCHLLDVADPNEDFHLFAYLKLAQEAVAGICSRNRLPILCGGTPLYLKALLDGYDQDGGAPSPELRAELEGRPLPELVEMLRNEAPPELFARTDLTQVRRVIRGIELARSAKVINGEPLLREPLILAPWYSRQTVRQRIEERLDARLKEGLLDEVRRLHGQGVSWERMEWLGLEYRFAARHLTGALTYQEMRDTLLAHIRQFCKRQDGWFRKLERDGHPIHWLPDGDLDKAIALVTLWLARQPLPPPELRMDDIRYGQPPLRQAKAD
ncbi:MAG: tRNA (adenosine(37)-N6)-dimethylallyltransferase MiaA [Victivallales bacterium]|nr:tRNA (adenosine(37)-N6)-dimethylallyltransferase MiaA [Victivallales bacterium]